MISKDKITQLIASCDFSLLDGAGEVYSKKYGDVEIQLDIANNKIIYPTEIINGRGTTSNFNQLENLVVLECIDRLLTIGYTTNCIELERPFGAGRLENGQWLDILLKRPDGKAFAMIECKTYGSEFDKEHNKMVKSGGQLVNYFLNHRDVEYLILYASEIVDNKLRRKSEILTTAQFAEVSSREHLLEIWDRTFENNGFFDSQPYIFSPGIKKRDLIEITYADIYNTEEGGPKGTIFNRFAEILRRHAVSDKSNSYNKIFNLFLCKIVDEDEKNEGDETDFQWKKDETAEEVIGRLSELYKRGMQRYLKLEVTDHSEAELEKALSSNLSEKAIQIFREVRLYKDNEFAFKEVINKQTFDENARVVKEVVKLLELYQIKYSSKQQFLGDFFERLLNIGIKQESGQFFTPIPIARFMINSLPIEDIIAAKIAAKDADFLPYVIDYACGSGHFLTEIMSRIEEIVQELNEEGMTRPQRDNLNRWKASSYAWCNEFVYGVEKDYRLAKTTKVASFLNGDGEANIIYGDGLDKFGSSAYRGKLLDKVDDRNNLQFDIVIANPPFSVEGFKETLEHGDDSFELFETLGDNSDDIECLFVERTAQLLSDGRLAAVILPNSILTSKGPHQKARELLLKKFDIVGIQELGHHVFAATGNNTVVLFLRKKIDGEYKLRSLDTLISNFMENGKDFNFDGVHNIASLYAEHVYDEIPLKELQGLLNSNPDEIAKFRFYALTSGQNVVVSRFPQETEAIKRYLGYEHSQRDKYEGVHPYPRTRDQSNSVIQSMLYHDENMLDPTKVSAHLLENFNGKELTVSDGLRDLVSYYPLSELVGFRSETYTSKIRLDGIVNINESFGSTEQLTHLGDRTLFNIRKGSTITKMDTNPGNIPVIAGGQKPAYYHNQSNRDEEVICVSASGKYAGFVSFFDTPIWASDCITVELTAEGEKLVNPRYLYLALKSIQDKIYVFNTGNTNGHVYTDDIRSISLYVPNLDTQQAIVDNLWNKKSLTEKNIAELLAN